MAAPYTAAPATAPTAIPTDDGRTGELPLSLPPGLPSLELSLESEVVAAELAELIGVPPPAIADPGKTGIEGSIIPIKVTTDGLELVYKSELGFNRFIARVSTLSAGMKAIAKVVI